MKKIFMFLGALLSIGGVIVLVTAFYMPPTQIESEGPELLNYSSDKEDDLALTGGLLIGGGCFSFLIAIQFAIKEENSKRAPK